MFGFMILLGFLELQFTHQQHNHVPNTEGETYTNLVLLVTDFMFEAYSQLCYLHLRICIHEYKVYLSS